MPSNTPNYNLTTYDRAGDTGELFIDYRDDQAGTGSSNMTKIDTQMKVNADAVTDLEGVGRTTETVKDNNALIGVNAAGITNIEDDISQNIKPNIRYFDSIGTDTYTVTTGNGFQLSDGAILNVNFINANTGDSTINVDGSGARDIRNPDTGEYVKSGILSGYVQLVFDIGTNTYYVTNRASEEGTFTEHAQQASVASLPVGALDGPVSDGEVDGLTIQQMVDNTDDFGNWTISEFTVEDGFQVYTADGATGIDGRVPLTLASNTEYTFVCYVVENDYDQSFRAARSGEGLFTGDSVSIGAGFTGLVAETRTTDNPITNQELHQNSQNTTTVGRRIKLKTIILPGDWTSYDDTFLTQLVLGADFGLYSVKNPQLKSVGKNLINEYDFEQGGISTGSGNLFNSTANIRSKDYIPVNSALDYIYSMSAGYRVAVFYYAENDAYLGFQETASALTIPEACTGVKFTIFTSGGGDVNISDAILAEPQLEYGTSATAYEPYKSSILTANTELLSVPNGTKDTVDLKTGVKVKRCDKSTVGNIGVNSLFTSNINNDYVQLNNIPNAVVSSFQTNKEYIPGGFSKMSLIADSTDSIYTYAFNVGAEQIWLCVPKGIYVTPAEAELDLAENIVVYELAEPIIEEIEIDGIAMAYQNGTLYQDSESNVLPQATFDYALNTPAQVEGLNDAVVQNADNIVNVNDKIRNSFSGKPIDYYGNVKTADDGQDESLWIAGASAVTADTANVKIGAQSIRVAEIDNTATEFVRAEKNNISLDYTELSNGEISTDDDYINVVFYVSDSSFVDNVLRGVAIAFSQGATYDPANIKRYENIPNVVTGWNYAKLKKSDFGTLGTGSWTGIQSVRVYWSSLANAQNEYVSFQLIQLVKKDPEADYPNPFQRNGVRDFAINSGEWFVGEEFGRKIIKELSASLSDSDALLGDTLYGNFIAEVTVIATDTATTPPLRMYLDDNNRMSVSISSDNFRLILVEGGVVTNISKPYAINKGDELRFKIEKNNGTVTASVNDEVIITNETILSNLYQVVSMVNTINTLITSLSITEISYAARSGHADVADRLSEPMYIMATLSANQSIPSDPAFQNVVFDSTIGDAVGFYITDSGEVVATKSGKVYVKAHGRFVTNATGIRSMRIVRGGTVIGYGTKDANSGTPTIVKDSNVIDVQVGDILSMDVVQTSGGALDLQTGTKAYTTLVIAEYR